MGVVKNRRTIREKAHFPSSSTSTAFNPTWVQFSKQTLVLAVQQLPGVTEKSL